MKSHRKKTLLALAVLLFVVSMAITFRHGGRNVWVYIIAAFYLYIYYDVSSKRYATKIDFIDDGKLKVVFFHRPFATKEEEHDLTDLTALTRVKSFTSVNVFYILVVSDKERKIIFRMTNENLLWNKKQIEEVEKAINSNYEVK